MNVGPHSGTYGYEAKVEVFGQARGWNPTFLTMSDDSLECDGGISFLMRPFNRSNKEHGMLTPEVV